VKTCSKCAKALEEDQFYKDKSKKDGLRPDCKPCMWSGVDKANHNRLSAKWRAENPDKCREMVANWSAKNPGRVKEIAAAHFQKNKEAKSAANRAWVLANKDRSDELRRAWEKRNLPLLLEKNARRRAKTRQATPAWADRSELRRIYIECPDGYEVDHIVPLNGKTVCGFHAPNNLQYLTRSENAKKGAKHE